LVAGDVMLEINKFHVADITAEQFTTLMQSRPLHFKFIVNPMRISFGTIGAHALDEGSETDESEAEEDGEEVDDSGASEYYDIDRDNVDQESDSDDNDDVNDDDDDESGNDGDDEVVTKRQAQSTKTINAEELAQPVASTSSVKPKPATDTCKSGSVCLERQRLDGASNGDESRAEGGADEKDSESNAKDSERNSAESQARDNSVEDTNQALVPGTSSGAASKVAAAASCGYGQADAIPLAPIDIATDTVKSAEKQLDENQCVDSSRRNSVSDWYVEEEPIAHKCSRHDSLGSWYSDGTDIDRSTSLTMRYRLSVTAENFTPEQQATSELATALDVAMRADSIEELISVIGKAQAAGVMADVLDSASCRLAELQDMLERSATVASF